MRGSLLLRQLRTPHPALRATFSPRGEGARPSAPTVGHSTDASPDTRHAGLDPASSRAVSTARETLVGGMFGQALERLGRFHLLPLGRSAEHSEAMRGSLLLRQLRTPHPALRATFSPGGEGATPSPPTFGHFTGATHKIRHAGLDPASSRAVSTAHEALL
jgi:hypothetical protein